MSDHVDPVERAQAEAFDRELYGDGGLGEALANLDHDDRRDVSAARLRKLHDRAQERGHDHPEGIATDCPLALRARVDELAARRRLDELAVHVREAFLDALDRPDHDALGILANLAKRARAARWLEDADE